MRREKYLYNTQTLRYEKVTEPLSAMLLRIFGFLCAAVFSAFIFTLLAHRYLPSPNEEALLKENQQLLTELKKFDKEFEMIAQRLDNVKERHDYAHRMIYGMAPIESGVWDGGIGGHDKYREYRQFKHSGDMLIAIKERSDKLKRRLDVQSRSLDTIVNMVSEKEKMLASIPSIKPVRGDKLNRSVKLLSGFGMRIHPIFKIAKMHYGIDFSAPSGTFIQATGAGKIIEASYESGYGLRVVIDHGYGYRTLYGHMKSVSVKVGETVARGQKIGTVGSTGTSTAPHCHYEVHYHGKQINPLQYVTDNLTPQEYQELVLTAETQNQSFD